jgi:nucleotide-binding universal stress UspA family protein
LSYKSILVFLDDGKSNSDRVNAAISLAKSHHAHITGASLLTLRPEHVKIDSSEQFADLESKRLSESLVTNFLEKSSAAGIESDTIVIAGKADESANLMAHHGRNADLIILAQPNPDSRNYTRMLSFAEEVMLHSGRPILFMPYIGANKIPFKKALVSWDGTPAATRATYDAIPLLKQTKETKILVVQSKKQLESKTDVQAEKLCVQLSRHGIHCHVNLVSPGSSMVATVILNEISQHDIDVLVMGGYGTPSLKQKILGGVTRSLLTTMLIPVLMAH